MGKIKNKKEKYIENRGVFGTATDYHVYHMTPADLLMGFLKGFGIGGAIIFIFFRTPVATLIVGTIAGIIGVFVHKKRLLSRRYETLLDQFKEMLEALATSFSSGRNSVEAFGDAYKDLSNIYPKDAYILVEIKTILDGIQNNQTVETMLRDFGDRSGLEDISSFTDVFVETGRQGGNMTKVISDARVLINEKIDTEREIRMITHNSKVEFDIMMCIPFFILLIINSDSSMSIVENTHFNIVIKVIVLSIFGGAYLLARKMLTVKA